MKNLFSTIWAESLKIRRSKVLWITILFFIFVPVMTGVLMFVVKNPEVASKFGLIGTKSAMLEFGDADWPSYFGLLNQVIAGLGLLGFGFVASWVFGREYSDRTAKDLLALPISRASIVLSKFIVVAIWCVFLSFIVFTFGIVAGCMIQLSGWSSEIMLHSAYVFAITSLLSLLLCTPVAFFASYGRGYLPPIGFIILTLVLAQFVGAINIAPYFPWAIPILFTGTPGIEGSQLGVISYIILFFTSILGLIGTLAWWHFADQY